MDAMGIQASTTFPIRLCIFRKQHVELQTITMFLYFFLKEISICIADNFLIKKKKKKSIFLKRISLFKKIPPIFIKYYIQCEIKIIIFYQFSFLFLLFFFLIKEKKKWNETFDILDPKMGVE